MAVLNTYFRKKEEQRVTYKGGERCAQVDYVLCRRCNLKEISDCKVVVSESVAKHWMMVCRMTMEARRKRVKAEPKIRWWKLRMEDCCEQFREEVKQALSCCEKEMHEWVTVADVVRKTVRKVLGMSSGQKKEGRDTWWCNEEVQECIRGKRLAKKNWDNQRNEEIRQEYKDMCHKVKRIVAKVKGKAFDEVYEKLDAKEGEKDLYRLVRQRDRAGKDVQQVRVLKDSHGNVLTSVERVLRQRKEYFEELMNGEN